MPKTIFEKLGGKYVRQGDYIIPCLTVPTEEEHSISIWGQRHLDYLKQYRKVTYTNLLTSGKLNTYLADIDRQAIPSYIYLTHRCNFSAYRIDIKAKVIVPWHPRIHDLKMICRICMHRLDITPILFVFILIFKYCLVNQFNRTNLIWLAV